MAVLVTSDFTRFGQITDGKIIIIIAFFHKWLHQFNALAYCWTPDLTSTMLFLNLIWCQIKV